MSLGRPVWKEVRSQLMHTLSADVPDLRDNQRLRDETLVHQVRQAIPAQKCVWRILTSYHNVHLECCRTMPSCICQLPLGTTQTFICRGSMPQIAGPCSEALIRHSVQIGMPSSADCHFDCCIVHKSDCQGGRHEEHL